MAFVKLLL